VLGGLDHTPGDDAHYTPRREPQQATGRAHVRDRGQRVGSSSPGRWCQRAEQPCPGQVLGRLVPIAEQGNGIGQSTSSQRRHRHEPKGRCLPAGIRECLSSLFRAPRPAAPPPPSPGQADAPSDHRIMSRSAPRRVKHAICASARREAVPTEKGADRPVCVSRPRQVRRPA